MRRQYAPGELARRWRRIGVASTFSGAVTSTVAIVYMRRPWSAIVVAFMAVCVADTWYVARRFRGR